MDCCTSPLAQASLHRLSAKKIRFAFEGKFWSFGGLSGSFLVFCCVTVSLPRAHGTHSTPSSANISIHLTQPFEELQPKSGEKSEAKQCEFELHTRTKTVFVMFPPAFKQSCRLDPITPLHTQKDSWSDQQICCQLSSLC